MVYKIEFYEKVLLVIFLMGISSDLIFFNDKFQDGSRTFSRGEGGGEVFNKFRRPFSEFS